MRDSFEAVSEPTAADDYLTGGVAALMRLPLPRLVYLPPDADFVDRIAALYTPDEREFLRRMAATFARVKLGFTYFGLLNRHTRPFEALAVTAKQPRSGWLRIGVPSGYVQSVMDHHKSGEKLAQLLYAGDPTLDQIIRIFRYHDIGEAVIGDFTPHDPIGEDDKIKLEALAVRLIVGRRPGVWVNPIAQAMEDSFRIYEGMIPGHDAVRVKVKDLDLLEMTLEATMIRHACPPHARANIDAGLAEFDTYVSSRLQTAPAKAFFAGLIDPAHRYADPVQVWRAAAMRLTP